MKLLALTALTGTAVAFMPQPTRVPSSTADARVTADVVQGQQAQARRDQPWTPTDTGTVQPGMTRAEVVAVWGAPITERANGPWTYLYYRNGCEYSCGTHDVVFLENGQVVDAIVRGPGHRYAGMSSSPPGRVPERTVPGTNGSE